MAVPLPSVKPTLRSRLNMRWYSWLFLAGAIMYGISWLMHWDDRGALWVLERFESPMERRESIWLPDYQAVIDAKPLPGMEKDEASDLAYDPRTKTLFAVMGRNPFLVELSLQGDVLRKIPMVGWSNPEGVTVMENGVLAIVDERRHNVTLVKVDADTRQLAFADYPSYDLAPPRTRTRRSRPSPGTSAINNWCWVSSAQRSCLPGPATAARSWRATSRNCPAPSWISATFRP